MSLFPTELHTARVFKACCFKSTRVRVRDRVSRGHSSLNFSIKLEDRYIAAAAAPYMQLSEGSLTTNAQRWFASAPSLSTGSAAHAPADPHVTHVQTQHGHSARTPLAARDRRLPFICGADQRAIDRPTGGHVHPGLLGAGPKIGEGGVERRDL